MGVCPSPVHDMLQSGVGGFEGKVCIRGILRPVHGVGIERNTQTVTTTAYHCGFEYHRDGVGAINLYNKVSGFLLSPVVGAMASPIGVRFDWHLCKSG